jgi:predicted amidohydrolase
VPKGDIIRIAVFQQDHNPGELLQNRSKALAPAARALECNAELILFHEELLLGCTPRLKELAEPVDGSSIQSQRQR